MKKAIKNKLAWKQSQVSKIWESYRKKKAKILKNKSYPKDIKRGLVQEQLSLARSNISELFSEYREYKSGTLVKSPYSGFSFVRQTQTSGIHDRQGNQQTRGTIQKYFKSKQDYISDDIVRQVLDEPNVIGVSLTYKVRDNESEQIHYGSDFMTKGVFERLQGKGISMDEHLATKFRYMKSMQDYEVISVYIRIIYAKT